MDYQNRRYSVKKKKKNCLCGSAAAYCSIFPEMHCEKTTLKAVSLVLDAVDRKCMFVLAQNLQLTTEQSESCL